MAATRVLPLGVIVSVLGMGSGCGGQMLVDQPLRPAPTVAAAKPAKPMAPASPNAGAPVAKPAEAAPATAQVAAPPHPLEADKFTAHNARTLTYDSQNAKGEAITTIVVQDALPDCHCAGRQWWVRYYEGDTKGQAKREVHLTIDASGYIAETEEIDRTDKVEVVYTPALVLVPDKLPAKAIGSAAYEQDVQMVVHPLGDRTKVKTHGTAKNQITFEGDEKVATGVGVETAHRLTCTVTADLSAAKTVDVTEQWLLDGVGVIAQREREETRVMGAKVRDNSSTMLLKSFEASK